MAKSKNPRVSPEKKLEVLGYLAEGETQVTTAESTNIHRATVASIRDQFARKTDTEMKTFISAAGGDYEYNFLRAYWGDLQGGKNLKKPIEPIRDDREPDSPDGATTEANPIPLSDEVSPVASVSIEDLYQTVEMIMRKNRDSNSSDGATSNRTAESVLLREFDLTFKMGELPLSERVVQYFEEAKRDARDAPLFECAYIAGLRMVLDNAHVGNPDILRSAVRMLLAYAPWQGDYAMREYLEAVNRTESPVPKLPSRLILNDHIDADIREFLTFLNVYSANEGINVFIL